MANQPQPAQGKPPFSLNFADKPNPDHVVETARLSSGPLQAVETHVSVAPTELPAVAAEGSPFAPAEPPPQPAAPELTLPVAPQPVTLGQLEGQAASIGNVVQGVETAVSSNLMVRAASVGSAYQACFQSIVTFLGQHQQQIVRDCGGVEECVSQHILNLRQAALSYAAAGGCPLSDAGQAWNQATEGGQSPFNLATYSQGPGETGIQSINATIAQQTQEAPPPQVSITPAEPVPYSPIVAPQIQPQPAPQPKAPPFCDPASGVPCPQPQPQPGPGGGQLPFNPANINCAYFTSPPPAPGPGDQNLPPNWRDSNINAAIPYQQNAGLDPCAIQLVGGYSVNVYTGAVAFSIGGQAGYLFSNPNTDWSWVAKSYLFCKYNSLGCSQGGGGGGTSGSGGGGSGGGGQCPAPPPCPVCQKPACDCSCLQKCQQDNTKPKIKWYVYKRADGSCYTAEQTEPTEIEGDELVGEYDNETEAILTAQKCKQSQLPKPFAEVPVSPQIGGGIWCSTEVCTAIDETLGAIQIPAFAAQPWIYAALVQGANYDPDQDASLQNQTFIVKLVLTAIKGSIGSIAVSVGSFIRGMFCPSSGQSPAFFSINLYRSVVGFLSWFMGPVAADMDIEPGYTSHYLCPQRIPTSDQADACFLADAIDTSLWTCWVRANNDCDEPRLRVIDAKRSRLGVGELVALYMRGEIDHPTYYSAMRELGYLFEAQADQYLTLANQIPPVSELIRMMVRDVADDALVQQFGMDDSFNQKWTGQLKKWGNQQGIGDLFAKYEWRAHWSIPSPGQLYEMYHRFRRLDPADPRYVSEDTIKTALQQQDILPYWIDKFLGISFRPLTRIDARRAFEVGAIDADGLRQSYADQGYDDKNSDTLVAYNKKLLAVQLRSKPPVKLYLNGNLSYQQAKNLITADGIDGAIADSALEYAKAMAAANTTAKCIKSLHKRYLQGEFDTTQLTGSLVGLGLDTDQAVNTAAGWQCERSARGKFAPASLLCKWFKSGIITQDQHVKRLQNLGWKADEIQDHLDQCQKEIDDAAAKEALKQQKEQEAAAAKAARQAAQLARQQQQLADKLARELLKQEKLARAQYQKIVKAAMLVVKNAKLDWNTAIITTINALQQGVSQFGLDWQAAIDAAYNAAYSTKATAPLDVYTEMVEAMYAEYESFQTSAADGSQVL